MQKAPVRLTENDNGTVQIAKNREQSSKRVSKVENDVAELKMRLSNLSDINDAISEGHKGLF